MQEELILVVIRHKAMRVAVGDMMRQAFPEHPVLETATPADVTVTLQGRRRGLVVLDFTVLGAEGFALVARLLAENSGMRIIVIGQQPASIYAQPARTAGAFGYVDADHLHVDLLPLTTRALDHGGADA